WQARRPPRRWPPGPPAPPADAAGRRWRRGVSLARNEASLGWICGSSLTSSSSSGSCHVVSHGRCHCWLPPPLQAHRSSWVPLAVLEPGSSRHLPEAGLTSWPLLARHCWLAPPLQVHSSMRVPLAVLAPVMSMHLPRTCTVPLDSTVQAWLAPPLQSQIWILVPSAEDWPLSSTHLALLTPAVIGPVTPPPDPPTGVTDRLSNCSVW